MFPVEIAASIPSAVPNRRLPMLSWLLAVADGKKTFEPRPILPPPVVMVVLVVLLSPMSVLL